jgi:type IV pilus assembly protein PilB
MGSRGLAAKPALDAPTQESGGAHAHGAEVSDHHEGPVAQRTDLPPTRSPEARPSYGGRRPVRTGDGAPRNGRQAAGSRHPWGEILVARGVITQDQWTRALDGHRSNGARLCDVLRSMGVAPRRIAEALSAQLGIPMVRLDQTEPDEAVVRMIPEELARRHQALPIAATESRITVAFVDPFDVIFIDDIRRLTRRDVDVVVTPAEDFDVALSRHLARDEESRGAEPLAAMPAGGAEPATDTLPQKDKEAPIARLVSKMLGQGIARDASDILIEAQDRDVRVRYRVDGVLADAMSVPKHLHPAVISRLKSLAGMDTAEPQVPHDGRFRIRLADSDVDIRVSTIPTVHGENVGMRLLARKRTMTLDELGLSAHDRPRVDEMMQRRHGIFLMTGPTGSGKTNSVYALLNVLNTADRKILTIEDPVDASRHTPGLMQFQIHPKSGLTFPAGRRAFLCHDPGIITVGEIRDAETAMSAVQAALTGHLVLSTLHTNDSIGAVTRLLDMGVEPYLLASTLLGAGAQRLVGVLCRECRAPAPLDVETAAWLAASGATPPGTIYRARGCSACQDTGYCGRTGLFEIMRVTWKMRTGIAKRAPEHELHTLAAEDGMQSLLADGARKIAAGITSVDEVLRVINVAEAEPKAA